MSVARELASFAVDQQGPDLPERAMDHARMLIASTVASAALGSTIESAAIIRAIEVERGGEPEATVWFLGAERVPAVAAARVNAVMSDAAASDDSDLRTIVHQGTTACSSALAVAERQASTGEEVLAAIVLGYEVTGRLNTALQHGFKHKGFHGCIMATFAGAVAAGRLLELSTEQMTHTIGLAATSAGGLMAAASTSWAREYQAGLAAMLGVSAAYAAAKGFTSEENILEAPRGFLEAYGQNADAGALTARLGERWSILEDMGIKLMPGGHPFHAVAEAAANAAREGDVAPEAIEVIEIARPGFRYTVPDNPTDLIGIAHSPAYFAAAAVIDREFTWAHAQPEKILDPRIRRMLAKVRYVEPPTEYLERYKSGAVVTLRTVDGHAFASTVYAPRGAAALGIAWQDVEAKYRALVPHAGVSDANLDASLEVLRNFQEVRHVGALVQLLR